VGSALPDALTTEACGLFFRLSKPLRIDRLLTIV